MFRLSFIFITFRFIYIFSSASYHEILRRIQRNVDAQNLHGTINVENTYKGALNDLQNISYFTTDCRSIMILYFAFDDYP